MNTRLISYRFVGFLVCGLLLFAACDTTSKPAGQRRFESRTPKASASDEADATEQATPEKPDGLEKSFEELLTLAEKGDAEAQCKLADHYLFGIGTEPDEAAALRWYRRAAEQNYAWAQHHLAVCYAEGRGVEADPKEAARLWTLAADQGLSASQLRLGDCYYDGLGVSKDRAAAVKCYEKAAGQEETLAQYRLGLCLESGEGVPKDFAKASAAFRKAAEAGYAPAQWKYSSYCFGNDDLPGMIDWLGKAAGQDYAAAQFNLAVCYEQGVGVAKDVVKAREWFEKAAENGDARAVERCAEPGK